MKKTFENEAFFKTVLETLDEGKRVSFVIKGTSMLPVFKDGLTEVTLEREDSYKKFDVCLYKYKEHYFLHRLIKIKDDFYYFRGDHLYNFEVIKKDDILAKVYSFKTKEKETFINSFLYKARIKFYLLYKSFYMFLRKIYLGVKRGN
jgi:signal peptidase I